MAETDAVAVGIWSPFRSLLTAQALSAALGLVFWVIVARLVEAHDVGVAAAAISLQTLLGIVTVLGCSTMLVSELPKAAPTRQRTLVLRSLLVVFVSSAIGAGLVVAVSPLLPSNLEQALGNPIGAVTFVLGTAAFAWALVVDDACLGVKRSGLQVWRNLVASSLRFPAHGSPAPAGVHRRARAPGLLGAAAARLHPVHAVAAPAAAARPDQPTAAGGHPRLHRSRPAQPCAEPVAGRRVADGPGRRGAHAELGGQRRVRDRVADGDVRLPAAVPPVDRTVRARRERQRGGVPHAAWSGRFPRRCSLSALLCVGAWVLGEPVLLIFGGDYSRHSWAILALLVPAGLWMVIKDHLVALWRTQRQFALATRLAGAALVIEIVGAMAGGIIGGARGLCIGWLIAMGVEMVLGLPWLRRAFGGLHWRWPLPTRRRTELGRAAVQVVVGRRAGPGHRRRRGLDRHPAASRAPAAAPRPTGCPSRERRCQTCEPTRRLPRSRRSTSTCSPPPATRRSPIRTYDEVRELVGLAQAAGAQVISTSTSFRTMQPVEGQPIRFGYIDRTIGAARSAGLQVRLQLVGMPDWALDDPQYGRQAPRSEAELQAWADFVTRVMRHVNGKVDYLEVWNEPNESKWWPTGPDPVEFARLLAVTYAAVHRSRRPPRWSAAASPATTSATSRRSTRPSTSSASRRARSTWSARTRSAATTRPTRSTRPSATTASPFGLYDENFTGFMGLHDVMAKHGDEALPVYITQFGYSTRAAEGRKAVPDELRAQYLTQALKQTTCVPYVPVFSWYALHPTPWDPQEYTLLDKQNRPNQTYEALAAWGRKVAEAGAGG